METRVIWTLGFLLLLNNYNINCADDINDIPTKIQSIIDEEATRLPTGIKPVSYFLQIQPSYDHDTFRGHVFINISVSEVRNVITLHAAPNLRVKQLTLDDGNSGTEDVPSIERTERDNENSLLFIYLSDSLIPGYSYRLGAEFFGYINNITTEGLFKAHYMDQETGEVRWYIGTSFKPILARTAFPCFDEPAIKSSFTVSVARPKDSEFRTISNMPHSSTLPMINDASWVWDTFEASPPMSTYAVSFLTSDLVTVPNELVQDTTGLPEIRIWSRSSLTEQTAWARLIAPRAIPYLERRLHVRFPLSKVDFVALPNFVASQPAENWGLVFYREGDILSSGYNRWVTNYIVSELTRQWLGGLITPDWWTDTWINKALVSFVTDSTTAELGHPEDKVLHKQAFANIVYSLFYEYSQRVPYKRIPEMKESIKSSKALVILNMLNSTLDEETMALALHDLISKKQYSTYEQTDLWIALDKRAHGDDSLPLSVNARSVADTWISNDRFPVLSVTRDYLGNLNIAQKQFIRDPMPDKDDNDKTDDDDDTDTNDSLWWIPVLLAPQPERRPDGVPELSLYKSPALWMPPTRRINNLSDPAQADRFILVNPEELGLIMVNYDRRNWALLADHLRRTDVEPLTPATRAKLLHDSFNLAMGNILDFGTALDVSRFLNFETRPEPWQPFFNIADHLLKKLDGTSAGKLFSEYVLRLTVNLDKIEKGETKIRSNVRRLLCKLGHDSCIRKSRDIYAKWMRMETPERKIPAHGTLCPVFTYGTREEYKFGIEVLTRSQSIAPDDRMSLLLSLSGCPREGWRLEKLLNVTFLQSLEGNSVFSSVDKRYVLMHLGNTHSGYLSLFRFLQKHFNALKAGFHGHPTLWSSLISTATGSFKTYDELRMVTEFAKLRRGQFGTAEKVLKRSMQRVELESSWSQRHLADIENWLMKEIV